MLFLTHPTPPPHPPRASYHPSHTDFPCLGKFLCLPSDIIAHGLLWRRQRPNRTRFTGCDSGVARRPRRQQLHPLPDNRLWTPADTPCRSDLHYCGPGSLVWCSFAPPAVQKLATATFSSLLPASATPSLPAKIGPSEMLGPVPRLRFLLRFSCCTVVERKYPFI